MKKRYLWIEDFDNDNKNDNRKESELKEDFLISTQLSEEVVTFAGDFSSALKEINALDCLYDTILIDIDFPADEKMPPELKGYITPQKYQSYVQKVGGKNKAGYPLFLYLLMAKRFPSSKICFMSANIFAGGNQFPEVDEIRKYGGLSINREDTRNKYESLQTNIEEIGEKIGITESVPDCPEEYFSDRKKLVQHLIENILPMIDAIETRQENKGFISSFKDFLEEFDNIGIARPIYFEKNVMRKKLLDFITQDNAYYQLRYCIINMCDNIISQIESKHTEVIRDSFLYIKKNKETGEEEERKYQKYTEEDFKHLLENIKSRFHHFKPEDHQEQQIYFNIVSDVVSFMEILKDSKEEHTADYITLKFLRNMIAHGKIKKVSLEFCAFIFGISMRFLFRIDNKEYQKLESFLLDCIGPEQKNITVNSRDKLKALLNEAYQCNKSEFSVEDHIYRIFKIIGSEKSKMKAITLQHFYQLYVLRFYQIKKEKIQIENSTDKAKEITTSINLKIESDPTNPDEYFKRIINLI